MNRRNRCASVVALLLLAMGLTGCNETMVEPLGERIEITRTLIGYEDVKLKVHVHSARRGDPAKAPTALLLHGFLSNKTTMYTLANRLARAGWNVVRYDQRGHGTSETRLTTWGAKEKLDAKAVLDTLCNEKLISNEIYVAGASMGGCVAVQYAALDPRCQGCLAMVPPTGLRGAKEIAFPLATKAMIDKIVAAEAKENGYEPKDADAILAASQLHCPLIVVRGKLDILIPAKQVLAIYDAAPQPKLLLELFAGHVSASHGHDEWVLKQMNLLRKMRHEQRKTKSP